jgi:hypothetical protein
MTDEPRESVEAVKEIEQSRTPMSIRILPKRPSAYAALGIALAQALPQSWTFGKIFVIGCVVFILYWQARVRKR